MMRNILLSLLASSLLLGTGVQAQDKAAAGDKVVATVGNKNITLKDFNEKYDEVIKQTINPPPRDVFLEDLVRYEMGVQEANKRSLENDPVVKERIRQEIYKGLIEKELGKKVQEIKVTEDEMKNYYQKNPEVRTSHILIEFKPDATEAQKAEARDRAKKILEEVHKSKRPFEELVAIYTDDVLSKKTGGDVGWQSRLTLVPTYYDAALKMKIGDLSNLIETQYGYHIIKVTGRHPYGEANKRQIRAAVFDDKRKQIFDAYFANLKKQYPIKVFKENLK